jgi:hypothetical protein
MGLVVVAGCSKPTTTSASQNKEPATDSFAFNGIFYEIPKGFSIIRRSGGEVFITPDYSKEFGITHLKPKLAKKGLVLDDIIARSLPDLERDLVKEGKKGVSSKSITFDKNRFRGFTYANEHDRENYDGYLTVGKHMLDIRFFLPKSVEVADIRNSLRSVLNNLREANKGESGTPTK